MFDVDQIVVRCLELAQEMECCDSSELATAEAVTARATKYLEFIAEKLTAIKSADEAPVK